MNILIASWVLLFPIVAWGDPLALRYLDQHTYTHDLEGSSLPSRFNEQVVEDTTATMRRVNVPAIFAVFPNPYEEIRDHISVRIRQVFGETQYTENTHEDLVEWEEKYGKVEDPTGFHKQRRRDAEHKLTDAGIQWQSYREARFVTKSYNEVWWKRGRSQAIFRIIDGRDLFSRPCTLVMLWRTDYELRFGFLHSLPVPVLSIDDIPLVTNREIAVLEQVKGDLRTSVSYYPASISSLLDNAPRLIEIRNQ